MKRWLTTLATSFCLQGHSQTFSEWFFQNKTQIKYLHKQIAALAVFIYDNRKGYSIVQAGTGLIGGLQQEDQDQHRDYFASFKTAKQAVVSDAWVSAIRDQAARIKFAAMACMKTAGGNQWLTRDEKDLIQYWVIVALGKVSDQMTLLDQLLAPGGWEMSDAERVDRIDDVELAMANLLLFIVPFRNFIDEVVRDRSSDRKDAENMMLYYGKKPE